MFWPGEYETLKRVYFATWFSDQGWSTHILEATVMPWISFTQNINIEFENFLQIYLPLASGIHQSPTKVYYMILGSFNRMACIRLVLYFP